MKKILVKMIDCQLQLKHEAQHKILVTHIVAVLQRYMQGHTDITGTVLPI